MPFPSCCEASPARPRRGSSSPRLWVAGFSSGMPVAEAIVGDGASMVVVDVEEQKVDLDYESIASQGSAGRDGGVIWNMDDTYFTNSRKVR